MVNEISHDQTPGNLFMEFSSLTLETEAGIMSPHFCGTPRRSRLPCEPPPGSGPYVQSAC